MSVAGVLLTTTVLHTIDSYLTAQHLVLGYLLPTILVAIYYGSNVAVFTSFASGLAAAYFLFPPKFTFYITDITHIAELGFFLVLASIASKAVSVLADDSRETKSVPPPVPPPAPPSRPADGGARTARSAPAA